MGCWVEAGACGGGSRIELASLQKSKELVAKDKVSAVFGCWTSVSRKSVLPVFEELNSILSTRCSMRGRVP